MAENHSGGEQWLELSQLHREIIINPTLPEKVEPTGGTGDDFIKEGPADEDTAVVHICSGQ